MFTSRFWKDAAERAVKSVAQALAVYLGGDALVQAWSVDWKAAGYLAAAAAGASLLTSLASLRLGGDTSSASAVNL